MTSPAGDGNGLNDRAFVIALANWFRSIATHPAGQSAGSGAWAEHSPQEIVRRTRCMADETRDPVVWRDCCDLILERLGKPAPDSTCTGDGGTEETVAVPASALRWLFGEGPDEDGAWFGDQIRGKGAFWWRSEFRKRIEAARPAAPEAQGAWVQTTERFVIAVKEFLADWRKGDFILPKLAELDAESIEAALEDWASRLPAPPASSGQGGR